LHFFGQKIRSNGCLVLITKLLIHISELNRLGEIHSFHIKLNPRKQIASKIKIIISRNKEFLDRNRRILVHQRRLPHPAKHQQQHHAVISKEIKKEQKKNGRNGKTLQLTNRLSAIANAKEI